MTNTMITINDLYSPEELAQMTMEEIRDILHDIYGSYEDIRKDAFIAYMSALSESKS